MLLIVRLMYHIKPRSYLYEICYRIQSLLLYSNSPSVTQQKKHIVRYHTTYVMNKDEYNNLQPIKALQIVKIMRVARFGT